MTVIIRQRARQAKPIAEERLPVDNNLNSMPAGIIDVIVQHLRAIADKPQVRRKSGPCECVGQKAPRVGKQEKELPATSVDPCLALSCVSKWLRIVVYYNQLDRSICTTYCDWGIKQSRAASEVMRDNVL